MKSESLDYMLLIKSRVTNMVNDAISYIDCDLKYK